MYEINMRLALYNYIKEKYYQNIECFCNDNLLSVETIENFIKGNQGGYLKKADFKKILEILDPPQNIKDRWKSMYLNRTTK